MSGLGSSTATAIRHLDAGGGSRPQHHKRKLLRLLEPVRYDDCQPACWMLRSKVSGQSYTRPFIVRQIRAVAMCPCMCRLPGCP